MQNDFAFSAPLLQQARTVLSHRSGNLMFDQSTAGFDPNRSFRDHS